MKDGRNGVVGWAKVRVGVVGSGSSCTGRQAWIVVILGIREALTSAGRVRAGHQESP